MYKLQEVIAKKKIQEVDATSANGFDSEPQVLVASRFSMDSLSLISFLRILSLSLSDFLCFVRFAAWKFGATQRVLFLLTVFNSWEFIFRVLQVWLPLAAHLDTCSPTLTIGRIFEQ